MGKRKKWKIWLASAAALYCFSGSAYTIFGSAISEKEKTGFYNKTIKESEFREDLSLLEKKLKEKKREEGKTNISLTVLVHEDIKRFFDDAENPDDDRVWTEKVKEALGGLQIYEPEGFGFTIDNVFKMECDLSGFREQGQQEGLLIHGLSQGMKNTTAYLRGRGTVSTYIVYFFPAYEGRLGGFASLSDMHAAVFLSRSESYNSTVLAHEVGHLFGLGHAGWNMAQEILDPFFIFSNRDLMLPVLKRQIGGRYILSNEEKEYLRKIRIYY